jgi:hypothetical protein
VALRTGKEAMLRLFRLHNHAQRTALKREFDAHLVALRGFGAGAQMTAGQAINLSMSVFCQRFGSAEAFRELPPHRQAGYHARLGTKARHEAAAATPSALGFLLFRTWVAALISDDERLIQRFTKQLSALSGKAHT